MDCLRNIAIELGGQELPCPRDGMRVSYVHGQVVNNEHGSVDFGTLHTMETLRFELPYKKLTHQECKIIRALYRVHGKLVLRYKPIEFDGQSAAEHVVKIVADGRRRRFRCRRTGLGKYESTVVLRTDPNPVAA